MPSAQDIFNELVKLGAKLDALNATSQAIQTDDDQIVQLMAYADTALYLTHAEFLCASSATTALRILLLFKQ